MAQEVLKAVSGKFGPLEGWLEFDALECLPSVLPTEEECTPPPSRYSSQIAVFGTAFQHKLASQKQFLVGAGAIGCEMLKNWSLMGLGTQGKGGIVVTDLDTIEKSNLNRQFLFRKGDLGGFKSEAAVGKVVEINGELGGRCRALRLAVGGDTEGLCWGGFF